MIEEDGPVLVGNSPTGGVPQLPVRRPPGPRIVLGIGPRGSTPSRRQVLATRTALRRISPGLKLNRLFGPKSDKELARIENLARERNKAFVRPGLARYFVIEPPPGFAKPLLSLVARFADVRTAYMEFGPTDPPNHPRAHPDAIDQRHLRPAPEGINAENAWAVPGGGGEGVRVGVVEQGWQLGHPDLADMAPKLAFGLNHPAHRGHGTSVLGLLGAGPNLQGCRGIAPGIVQTRVASQYLPPSYPDAYGTAEPIAELLTLLAPGDVLLLETQTQLAVPASTTNPNLMMPVLVPSEVEPAVFDLLVLAEALGITVVEAAGNGGIDLATVPAVADYQSLAPDQPGFVDSGAILVAGASVPALADAKPPLRIGSSNYGLRIDCFGPGQKVDTLDAKHGHTHDFSGTSSAAAVIAGAAACFQGMYIAEFGVPAKPSVVRAALASANGTASEKPAYRPGWIGYMPDLMGLAESLQDYAPGALVVVPGTVTTESGGRDPGVAPRPNGGVILGRPSVEPPTGLERPTLPGRDPQTPTHPTRPSAPSGCACSCHDRCPRCGKRRC